jgi:hypothetical protein
MSTHRSPARLAYDDAATPAEMTGDCLAVGRQMGLPGQRLTDPESAAAAFWEDYVRAEHGTPEVSEGLASRAAELELHLD